jgi:cytochrome c-type biogenesis protein CcmH/NrfG
MFKRILQVLAVLGTICLLVANVFAAKNEALDKAKAAASSDDWDQAVQFAQQATKDDPSNEEAWSFLGDAQMANGDTVSGIAAYEKTVALEARSPKAVLQLTTYYLKHDKGADAERVVAAAEERDKKGKFDEIKVARGMIFAQQGNMAEATKILASAAAKNPKNPLYPQILARIYLDKKVIDLAEKYYGDAWELLPGNPYLAYEYGLVLQDQKKYDKALDLFKQVQAKDPNNKTVDYLIGRLYFASRRFRDAADQFEKAIQKRPTHLLSYYLLGRSYFEYSKAEKINYYPQAEAALRKAHELKPERADVTAALAEVIFTRSRVFYQRALQDTNGTAAGLLDTSIVFAREALNFDTTLAGVYSQIARAWNKLGNLDSTIYYTQLQLVKTPKDEGEFARLVNALQRKKDQGALVAALQPAFEAQDWTQKKAPEDTIAKPQDKFLEKYAPVYVNALIESGKSAQARESLKSMISYNANWCDGYSLSAYIDLKRENWAGAMPSLLAGIRVCPKDGDLWNSLGNCYYFQNKKPTKADVEKARDAYQRACALGNKDACQNYKQLSQ